MSYNNKYIQYIYIFASGERVESSRVESSIVELTKTKQNNNENKSKNKKINIIEI